MIMLPDGKKEAGKDWVTSLQCLMNGTSEPQRIGCNCLDDQGSAKYMYPKRFILNPRGYCQLYSNVTQNELLIKVFFILKPNLQCNERHFFIVSIAAKDNGPPKINQRLP